MLENSNDQRAASIDATAENERAQSEMDFYEEEDFGQEADGVDDRTTSLALPEPTVSPEPTPTLSEVDLFIESYKGAWYNIDPIEQDDIDADDITVFFQLYNEKVHYSIVYGGIASVNWVMIEGDTVPENNVLSFRGADSNENLIEGTICIDGSNIPDAHPGDYAVLNSTVLEPSGKFPLELSDVVVGYTQSPYLDWPEQ